jgi:hypothetical protein
VWKREEACTAVAWSAGPQRRPCGMAQVAQTGALTIDASQRRSSLANGNVWHGEKRVVSLSEHTGETDITGPGCAEDRSLGQASDTARCHGQTTADRGQDETRRDEVLLLLDMRRIPGERN